MKQICTAIGCALVLSASLAQGAEYVIYKDPAGRIVLSNITPPPGAEVIQRHALEDVTDEAVRAALEREHSLSLRLTDEQLADSHQKLAESNNRLAEAINTASARRESEPAALVQVTSLDRSRFDGRHIGRFRQRGHLHSGFRHHSRFR